MKREQGKSGVNFIFTYLIYTMNNGLQCKDLCITDGTLSLWELLLVLVVTLILHMGE